MNIMQDSCSFKQKSAVCFTCVLFAGLFLMYPLLSKAQVKSADLLMEGQYDFNVAASLRNVPINAKWFDRAEFTGKADKPANTKNVLWYRKSAKVWEEALPLGNGRLGAMVFGGVADERIQLNENTLWDGYPLDPNNPAGREALPEVQRLLFGDKNNEAVKLAEATMMGNPKGVKSYQSLGELWFDTPELNACDYVRTLDLFTAVSTVHYNSNGVNYTREYFASAPDNVIVVRITADQKSSINLSMALKRAQDAKTGKLGNDGLLLNGQIARNDKEGNPRGISFAAQVKAVADGGNVAVEESAEQGYLLKVNDANTLTLYITGATNYPGMGNLAKGITDFSGDPLKKCAETIAKATSQSYDRIKSTHIADHQHYFGRVDLDLGSVSAEVDALSTNERLNRAGEKGEPDLGLVSTYFQFGRYLLIGSSRPGGMPANLQGLWVWQMNAPWNADFHTNINFQMNYWPSDLTNLSEMHLPLFDLMDMLVTPGERSAEVIYGARGWVVHHLTDAWGFTAPADGPQGIWPVGAAWLAQHPWEHYCFTGDKEFLAQRAWPLMKGAARFIMDFLVEAPAGTAYAGKLVTNPSYSPENAFILPNGEHSVFTYGATMDLEIIHNLLTNCIEAANILKVDADFRKECEVTLKRIPGIRISEKTGRILEWAEDYEEAEPHHRHTSHLFGLHPGNQITRVGTPALAEAARKTLVARGDGGTGWGLAWKINMWNRLHDGDHAFKLLSVLLAEKTLPNLFDDHPPFQIDGNFGATAAIAEMFLQSQLKKKNGSFEIHLLPSLPSAMAKSGSVKGLKARDGFTVNLSWKEGAVTEAQIHSQLGGKLHLRAGNIQKTYNTKPGETIKVDARLKQIDKSKRDSLLIVQITDPQFGFFSNNDNFEKETKLYTEAVRQINQIKPDLVVITGDFVNNGRDTLQINEFKRITACIEKSIPVYLSPGNHDLVLNPSKEDIEWYNSVHRKGSDRFSYRHKNAHFIGFNSVIIKSDKSRKEEKKQFRWLKKELKKADPADPILLFTHYPFFIENFSEKETYSNQRMQQRTRYFELFEKYGVDAVFAGHLHNNAEASHNGILVITTNAAGRPLGNAQPGYRLIKINNRQIEHSYIPIYPNVFAPSEELFSKVAETFDLFLPFDADITPYAKTGPKS